MKLQREGGRWRNKEGRERRERKNERDEREISGEIGGVKYKFFFFAIL